MNWIAEGGRVMTMPKDPIDDETWRRLVRGEDSASDRRLFDLHQKIYENERKNWFEKLPRGAQIIVGGAIFLYFAGGFIVPFFWRIP